MCVVFSTLKEDTTTQVMSRQSRKNKKLFVSQIILIIKGVPFVLFECLEND